MVTKKGFSLIELIIVIGLIAMLMLAISSSLLMSIISSNRIRKATATKQAGNYALDQMQSLIRNSKDITVCNSSSVTVTNSDGSDSIIELKEGRLVINTTNYLTPSNVVVNTSALFTCYPVDTTPLSNAKSNLIKIVFTLQDSEMSRSTENPVLHFETSVNLRNQ